MNNDKLLTTIFLLYDLLDFLLQTSVISLFFTKYQYYDLEYFEKSQSLLSDLNDDLGGVILPWS